MAFRVADHFSPSGSSFIFQHYLSGASVSMIRKKLESLAVLKLFDDILLLSQALLEKQT